MVDSESFILGLTSSGVDNMAHIGGAHMRIPFCCYFIQTEKNTL